MLTAKQEVRVAPRPAASYGLGLLPDISICIVNWNCSEYLRQLLTSIEAARDDLSVEIIVVDNASTDHSAAMVRAEFPEVQLIRNTRHAGIARANNQAAARARGSLLFFLNNDTSILPGGLAALAHLFEGRPELAAAVPRLTSPSGKLQTCARNALDYRALLHRVWVLRWTKLFCAADRRYRYLEFDFVHNAYVNQIVGPAILVRRQAFLSAGGWDEAFEFRMDDIDLSLRLGRQGRMFYLADAGVIHWGGVATDLDRSYAYCAGEFSIIYFIRKHIGRRAARLYKLLITIDMAVRISVLALCWVPKRLFGASERAARNFRKLTAACRFLRALPAYWAF